MGLTINIHETVSGDIFVKEVVDEKGFYGDTIPFDETMSITVLKRHTSASSEIVKAFIHNHQVTDVVNKFKVKHDGWYEVIHFVVPTLQAVEQLELTETPTYASDGVTIYYCQNGISTETSIETILGSQALDKVVTAVVNKSAFVLFNLWQCYLNYCKRMLEAECSKDSQCSDCNDEGTKNRHLIWIFLNAIQYYVKFGDFQTAQELLENISGCNSLCSNEMFSKLYDCGCGK